MELDVTLAKQPSLFRRLGALLYDAVLLLGVLMVANAIIVIPYEVISGHPVYESVLPLTLMRLYLVAVAAAFYVYFWTHGGQTLGMRAWRFRVIADNGETLSMPRAMQRFGWSLISYLPAGWGLLWSLIDREGLAWHDRRSGSRMVMLQKSA